MPASLKIASVAVSHRDPAKNVTLTLGGAGLERTPETYAVYLVKPHADATAVLRAFIADPKPASGHVPDGNNPVMVVGEGIGSPAQNTLVCTMPNPPAGSYLVAVTQVSADGLAADVFESEVKVPG
jgi:hypothetical protein